MNTSERATAAIFPDRASAQACLDAIEQQGFSRPWMAVTRPVEARGDAAAGSATDHGSEHDVAESSDGVLGAIGRFFSGEGNSLRRSLEDHGLDPDEAARIDDAIPPGGAVVVTSDERAASLLQQGGGRLAGAGLTGAAFGTGAARTETTDRPGTVRSDRAYDVATDATTATGARDLGEDARTLQLREERLRIDKERVAAGEATISKRVVSERTSVDVPLSHEELFIERRPISSERAASGPIGEGETIRVPLSREEVTVEKTPVVREEVSVGQRRVEEVRHVEETLRREELDVDDETAVRGTGAGTTGTGTTTGTGSTTGTTGARGRDLDR